MSAGAGEGDGEGDGIRVLVAEPIAEGGVDLLRARFTVDDGVGWSKDEVAERIGDYDGIVVRSATTLTADLIARATRLKVIGRAGTGVDNVDVPAATRRGIVVCNAPDSNAISAAEHALALLLSQARNVPQAHASLIAGRWERSRFGGIEVTGKTLGLIGFGRIGQMVADRARGLHMHVIAFDPFVADGRYRELGVEHAATPEDVYRQADFISLHMASTSETRGFVGREAFAAMKPTARLVNAARGDLVDQDALVEALTEGRIAGAGIDVFPTEPTTESPLFGLPGVVVTPHLGASTAEAQDRAGVSVAEQVLAALTGGVVTSAVNIPSMSPESLEVIGPFLPLARQMGQLLRALSRGGVSPLEVIYEGRFASLDTRVLTASVLAGLMRGHVEEQVNLVNAAALAEELGVEWSETSTPHAATYTSRLTLRGGPGPDGERATISGTTVGTTSRPRLVGAFDQEIEIELAPNMCLCRYRDVPGMIGRVGTILGAAEVNIASMAVSRSRDDGRAVMAITLDSPVPPDAAAEIAATPGFDEVWFVTLDGE